MSKIGPVYRVGRSQVCFVNIDGDGKCYFRSVFGAVTIWALTQALFDRGRALTILLDRLRFVVEPEFTQDESNPPERDQALVLPYLESLFLPVQETLLRGGPNDVRDAVRTAIVRLFDLMNDPANGFDTAMMNVARWLIVVTCRATPNDSISTAERPAEFSADTQQAYEEIRRILAGDEWAEGGHIHRNSLGAALGVEYMNIHSSDFGVVVCHRGFRPDGSDTSHSVINLAYTGNHYYILLTEHYFDLLSRRLFAPSSGVSAVQENLPKPCDGSLVEGVVTLGVVLMVMLRIGRTFFR